MSGGFIGADGSFQARGITARFSERVDVPLNYDSEAHKRYRGHNLNALVGITF